jgi:hypothetical protein
MMSAADMAKDLHSKHASIHTQEYYDITVQTLEPHVATVRKVYYDSVHPHFNKYSKTISDGVGAAVEGGKALSPQVMRVVQETTQTLSKGSSAPFFANLVKPQTFDVLGRKFSFKHGWVDVALALVQGMLAFYLIFNVMWKLFLKTLVWNIGIKLLGKKVFFGLVRTFVKVSFRLTRKLISISLYLVLTVVGIAFSLLLLAICGGLGVAMMHGIEKGAAVGLSAGIRLAAGAGVGAFIYLLLRCTCCKRSKKEKATNGKTKHTNGTNGTNGSNGKKAAQDPKKAAAPAAKQATKQPAKKK